jgi:hypothetical protein
MSGSDAPAGPGAGGGGGGVDACAGLRLIRNIEAPVPGVADQLTPGDTLEILLREGPPDLVVAVDSQGRDAGGITPTLQLINCLRQGVAYQAGVLTVHGGAVQVEVRAAL